MTSVINNVSTRSTTAISLLDTGFVDLVKAESGDEALRIEKPRLVEKKGVALHLNGCNNF